MPDREFCISFLFFWFMVLVTTMLSMSISNLDVAGKHLEQISNDIEDIEYFIEPSGCQNTQCHGILLKEVKNTFFFPPITISYVSQHKKNRQTNRKKKGRETKMDTSSLFFL